MTVAWPDALKVSRCDVQLRSMTKSGGRTAAGREQRVQADAGFLEITYEIPINRPEKARAFRAMLALLRAGQDILAKIFDLNQPRGAHGVDVQAQLAANVTARATQISITVTGAEVEAGTYIGVGSDRAHIVTDVVSGGPAQFYNHVLSNNLWDDKLPWSDASPNAKAYVVKILPPIRVNHLAGTSVKFRDITMRGVLSSMSDGDLSLDLGRFGVATLTIRESI